MANPTPDRPPQQQLAARHKQKCDNCYYMRELETDSHRYRRLQCRRRPPDARELGIQWPSVAWNDWCGEWAPDHSDE